MGRKKVKYKEKRDYKLHDLVVLTASKYLKTQNKDGSFEPGHNGPWGDIETPVRNTAHVSLIMFKAYKINKEKKYLEAAKKGCDYLLSKKTRPGGFNYYSREGSDPLNGVIGPAWAIEALIVIGKELKNKKYLKLAERIASMHFYHIDRKIWYVKKLNGTDGVIDETFNHQLWFGAMALTIGNIQKNHRLIRDAEEFFDNLPNSLTFLEPGVMEHVYRREGLFFKLKGIAITLLELSKGKHGWLEKRSKGYLGFNMHGFAIAYYHNPKAKCWKNEKLRDIIQDSLLYLIQNYPIDLLEGPEAYGWAYNPTGIEVAFSLETLGKYAGIKVTEKEKSKWISSQIKHYYNLKSGMMENNTCDKVVSSARFYEAFRLSNLKISLN